MKCIKGFEVQVLSSAAGYYIGTFSNEGPQCRISAYYKSKKQAQIFLENGFFGRLAPEISFCNGGLPCVPPKPPYILSYQYPDDASDRDQEFDDLNEARTKAQRVEEEGGWASIVSADGRELY